MRASKSCIDCGISGSAGAAEDAALGVPAAPVTAAAGGALVVEAAVVEAPFA